MAKKFKLINTFLKLGTGTLLPEAGKDLLNFFYPVGTIFETTNPALDTTSKMNAHFGGTWELYGQGRVLVGFNSIGTFNEVGKTGGAETHTLTLNQIPSHSHDVQVASASTGSTAAQNMIRFSNAATSFLGTVYSGKNGGGQSHNNLQPYIVAYRYRRLT